MLPAKAILESALVDVATDVPGFVELVLSTVKLISPILVPRNLETSSRFCASELKSKIFLYVKKKIILFTRSIVAVITNIDLTVATIYCRATCST